MTSSIETIASIVSRSRVGASLVDGDIVLFEEPDVTPFMRLENMLLAPLVPEQQL